MKTKYNPVLADATAAKIAGDQFKKNPIQPGFVRIERHSYHYGRQGQVNLSHYDCRDVAELDAINWLSGEHVSVQWPDGELEIFDLAVSPCRFYGNRGFGRITRANGDSVQVKLSRLPNVVVEYYRPMLATQEERSTFVAHVWE